LTIHRNPAQKREILSDDGIMEEFLFGNEIKKGFEGQAYNRDIRPVLMFWKNNEGPFFRRNRRSVDLNSIEERKYKMGNLFGNGIDQRIPSHLIG